MEGDATEKKVRMIDGFPVPIPQADRDWLTVVEIAEALEVSCKEVRAWVSVGVSVGELGKRFRVRLAHVRVGRKIRIYPDAVLVFLKDVAAGSIASNSTAPCEGDESRKKNHEVACAELVQMGIRL